MIVVSIQENEVLSYVSAEPDIVTITPHIRVTFYSRKHFSKSPSPLFLAYA